MGPPRQNWENRVCTQKTMQMVKVDLLQHSPNSAVL